MISAQDVKEFFVGAEKSETPVASFGGAALAKRKVANVQTGIDLFVPKYDTTKGAGRETLYHIIVISVMSVFKSPKHTADDVVQFSVPRKYADFERLQERLSTEFSAMVFPPLPSRRLYCTEDDLEDRLVTFDSMMRVVAKTKRLARSHTVLRFLGVDDALINRCLKETSSGGGATAQAPTVVEPEDEEEEEEVDIFADDENEREAEDVATLSLSSPRHSEDQFSGSTPDVSLHASVRAVEEEVQVDDFLLEAGCSAGASEKSSVFSGRTADRTKELTDPDGDLFQVEDELDSIEHLTKPKSKPRVRSKAKAKAPAVDESDALLTEKQFADLDLQQYIASNAAQAAEDVDLFS